MSTFYNDIKNAKKMDLPTSINRTNKTPLDITSIFESKDYLEIYILTIPTAYPGQIVAYKDDQDILHICIINSVGSVGDVNTKYTDITALIDNINLSIGNITGNNEGDAVSLASLKTAIDKINGDVDTSESFAKADLDLLRKIVGDINLTSDADISGKTLSALKTADTNILKNIIGDGETTDPSGKTLKDLNDAINTIKGSGDGSFTKADTDLLTMIYGNDLATDLPGTHTLLSLYSEIGKLQTIHKEINSVTYHAGVFDQKPVLTGKVTGDTINDTDNAPSFILKPGVTIIHDNKQYITVLKNDGSYKWCEIGPATIHESRFLGIEAGIGAKPSDTYINNPTIWDNIKNIYSILGKLNIIGDLDVYSNINTLDNTISGLIDDAGEKPDNSTIPATTMWSSILSLYLLMKDGDIRIDTTLYKITNGSGNTIPNTPYISTLWAGSTYTFEVTHTFNKTPIIDGLSTGSKTVIKTVNNRNTITVTATDAYEKSITETNTIHIEYPVLVQAYLSSSSINTTLPEYSSSPWYTEYEITVDGSSTDPGNIMVLVYNPSTSKKNVDLIITKVKGNGFDVEDAFTEVSMSDLEDDYVCYKLALDVTAKTTYVFTIKK